jgi:4-hydroxy-2-oxoheptanedioate aldolase
VGQACSARIFVLIYSSSGRTDVIFIGPNDLAMAILGYAPANYTEPNYMEALDRIQQTCAKYNMPVGILAPDGTKGNSYKGKYQMIGVGGDVKALVGWMGQELAKAKSE